MSDYTRYQKFPLIIQKLLCLLESSNDVSVPDKRKLVRKLIA